MNPIVPAAVASRATDAGVRGFPGGDGLLKLSAAALIEKAGFHKGFAHGNVGLSSKHTLAIINRDDWRLLSIALAGMAILLIAYWRDCRKSRPTP